MSHLFVSLLDGDDDFCFCLCSVWRVRGGGPWPTARVGCHLTVHYLLLRVVDLLHTISIYRLRKIPLSRFC